MTANQWRMLDILDTWGGMGTIEVEIQWGEIDFGEGDKAEALAFRTCRLVVAGLVRSLVRKGYATDDADGYSITEAGRKALERNRNKAKVIQS